MSLQRKRGQTAYVYPAVLVTDSRGNEQHVSRRIPVRRGRRAA